MVVVLYLYMWGVNRKRDREAAVSDAGLTAEQEKEAIERGMQVRVPMLTRPELGMLANAGTPQDVTELDNPGFRYVL